VTLARPIALALAVTFPNQSEIRNPQFETAPAERERVIAAADRYLKRPPQTITAFRAARSAGGPHDLFSEGDYWWPDPKNPGGPYIQRDGMSNPDNFIDHRRYLMRLSVQVPALAAAWTITKDQRFASHAAKHLNAWFVNKDTRMNPNLQYSQAIHGRVTGRGTGIIDTIHLVEVARAIELLPRLDDVKAWFADYLEWITTHQYGIEERDTKNNHATCWVMQAASFARLTGNADITQFAVDRFKHVLIPGQVAPDGSFPEELRRTKPYGYSLFNLDAMATICQLLSTPQDNLWKFELSDGRGIRKAFEFMVPYIRNKSSWPYPADVMYAKDWPMRHCALLFGGLAYDQSDVLDLWKTLPADSTVDEVIRNFFIRQPVLWA
jgi:Alginate lyase